MSAEAPGGFSSWLKPAAVILALVAADRATKSIIEGAIELNEGVAVIPGFFSIVHIRNKGAAFGLLGDVESEWVSVGFTAVSVIALAVIAALYRSLPRGEAAARSALVLIASGAAGNLIDRLRTGAVTDFLLFYIGEWQWPAFNVADSCITVGVALLGWSILMKPGAGKV